MIHTTDSEAVACSMVIKFLMQNTKGGLALLCEFLYFSMPQGDEREHCV